VGQFPFFVEIIRHQDFALHLLVDRLALFLEQPPGSGKYQLARSLGLSLTDSDLYAGG